MGIIVVVVFSDHGLINCIVTKAKNVVIYNKWFVKKHCGRYLSKLIDWSYCTVSDVGIFDPAL